MHELRNRRDVSYKFGVEGLELADKHPKLCAPVANVVDTHDFAAYLLKNTSNRVSNNSRTQMTHMHFFSDVRAALVDNNFLVAGRFDELRTP